MVKTAFVRETENGLELLIKDYVKKTGTGNIRASLISMLHIATPEFYTQILDIVKDYGSVLYEGIRFAQETESRSVESGPLENTADNTDALHNDLSEESLIVSASSISTKTYFKILSRIFSITTQKNFYNFLSEQHNAHSADVVVTKEHENKINKIQELYSINSQLNDIENLLDLLADNPEKISEDYVLFFKELVNSLKHSDISDLPFNAEREDILKKTFDKQILNHDRVAVTYGVKHMPEFENHLLASGFEFESECSLLALPSKLSKVCRLTEYDI